MNPFAMASRWLSDVYMKKIIVVIVLSALCLAGYKGGKYYSENSLYAHYVLKCYWEGLFLDIDNGYTDKISYLPGEPQKVFIDAKASKEQYVKLYNSQYQVVDSVKAQLSVQEKGGSPSEDGFGYKVSFTYEIPELKSGLYLWEKVIPFIIKSPEKAEIVVLYPSNTINAYNITGGKSLYSMFSEQTHVVSFLRPTFPAVSFQLRSGLDYFDQRSDWPLQYIADQDIENYDLIADAKLLIVIGHSEYWTRQARQNFDRFVDGGGNALILSGNTMWWQVRYEDNGTKMVCYKELPDPVEDPLLTTTFWTHEMLAYPVIPSIGADFPHGGFGRKTGESFNGLKVVASGSPIFEGTYLEDGDIINIPTKEYDGTLLKGDQEPLLDIEKLNFYRASLLAYDHAHLEAPGNGAFLIFQKYKTSGTVINTGTMDWCSGYGLGGEDAVFVEKITDNMIEGLWRGKDFFSGYNSDGSL